MKSSCLMCLVTALLLACARSLAGLGLCHIMVCGPPVPPVCPDADQGSARERYRQNRYETLRFDGAGRVVAWNEWFSRNSHGAVSLSADIAPHYDGTAGVVYPEVPGGSGSSCSSGGDSSSASGSSDDGGRRSKRARR